ncbi:MAG: mRNA surveillance protein Pelota [Desulfurococcales archaeon]|nr:mRNA surveillance protein Pelota [Desulfurococcales archaeon]
MKIISIDKRRENVRVRIEGEEDLWTLKTLLRQGDLVKARTYREVSLGGRGQKERRPLTLKIRVKNVEFQPFTGKLRIFGVIVEGPEEYGLKGKHHSLVLGKGQEVEIERPGGWSGRELRRIEESGPRGRAIIAAIDYDEYGIALLAPYGFKMLVEEYMRLPGKDDPGREQELESRIERVSRLIIGYSKEYDARVIAILGPGALKQRVAEKVKQQAPGAVVIVDDSSMGGRHGIEEGLRRGRVIDALREYYIAEANKVLADLLSLAARDPGRIATGIDDVRSVARLGAVERLVVIDSLLHDIDDSVRLGIDEVLSKVEEYRGRIIFIPEDSPPGEQVKRLGGVVAVLRYPVPREARRLSA